MNTLLLVHAYPHDESILNSGAVAFVHGDGHRVALVTATKGAKGHSSRMDGAAATSPGATAGAASTIVFGVERIVLARIEHANEQRPETTLFSGLQ